MASATECVTRKTVSSFSRHSPRSNSCIRSRMPGSNAPKGSSINRMRGPKISVAASATRCCHHKHAVSKINCFFDGVRNQENRVFLFSPQSQEQFLHSQPNAGVQRSERLVH